MKTGCFLKERQGLGVVVLSASFDIRSDFAYFIYFLTELGRSL